MQLKTKKLASKKASVNCVSFGTFFTPDMSLIYSFKINFKLKYKKLIRVFNEKWFSTMFYTPFSTFYNLISLGQIVSLFIRQFIKICKDILKHASFLLILIQGARIIKASHFDYEFLLGHKIVFICAAKGVPRPRITWFKDGIELHAHPFLQVTFKSIITIKFTYFILMS